ncbi:MAG: zinc-dependent metalloprotease, partial [Acidobacteriota bacterium]
ADDDGIALRMLMIDALVRGLGSNPVGLDRGRLGPGRVVHVRRFGRQVLFEMPNLSYRAVSDNPAEARAVAESFATSVVWGATIEARDPDGRALVDLSSFLVRDSVGVSSALRQADQGTYALDAARSAVDLDAARIFPDNAVFDAVLTFGLASGQDAGIEVEATAPDPSAITVRTRHTWVRLPDDGYQPRRFDPRGGSWAYDHVDYAAPLAAPLRRSFIGRHRLIKRDPTAARSEPVEPIVFYLDPGAPEPVRSALLDGARWWEEAFDAAGFIDGYRVEILPPDAHPLDARYNVIQWVHRATRGWSYGNSVVDPRTGEIIKGHVTLGSLRVRHDIRLFEGLLGADATGTGAADDPVVLSLARLRQLSANEFGHTIGLVHNFAASTYGGRASVMDYPAPLVRLGEDSNLDVSQAYGVGLGAWDVHAVRFAYAQFAPGVDEAQALDDLLATGMRDGLVFLSDVDARPPGAAEPRASLWDNGSDPVVALREAMAVRAHALARFGPDRLPAGQPLGRLEEVLGPTYFYHRYQAEAAAKVLGGVHYDYALRGDATAAAIGVNRARPLPAADQRAALDALLDVITPASLDLPEALLEVLLPPAFGDQFPSAGDVMRRERFRADHTAPIFDPLGAAATAADQVLGFVLQPERLARMVEQHRRDAALPDANVVIDAIVARLFRAPEASTPRLRAVAEAVEYTALGRLLGLAASVPSGGRGVAPSVVARADLAVKFLRVQLVARGSDAHALLLLDRIDRHANRQGGQPGFTAPPPPPPPGSPIGAGMWHAECSHAMPGG